MMQFSVRPGLEEVWKIRYWISKICHFLEKGRNLEHARPISIFSCCYLALSMWLPAALWEVAGSMAVDGSYMTYHLFDIWP